MRARKCFSSVRQLEDIDCCQLSQNGNQGSYVRGPGEGPNAGGEKVMMDEGI